MHATYLIPVPNVDYFKTKLDKLARKAAKLGAGSISHVLANTFNVPHPDPELAGKGMVLGIEAYTVKGEAPTLNGWEFVATLQHEITADGETINLVRSHADYDLPERYRTATPDDCDHCHTRRYRNDTFVVRNIESDEFKQVGRQCLKDFLSYHKSPAAIADFATQLVTFFKEIGTKDEDGWGGGGYTPIAFDVEAFLARTAVCIDDKGWTSRSKAGEFGTFATADFVWAHMTAKTSEEKRDYRLPNSTETTFAEVEEALAWLTEQPANEYIHNCQAIVEIGRVTYRTAGYLASVISSYRRASAKKLHNDIVLKADGTKHVGTVGKRSEFLLTLLAVIPIETDYGMSHLHKFADTDGNAVIWFASNSAVVPEGIGHEYVSWTDKAPMVKGSTYRVHATVKHHNEYEGQATTKVLRVTVKPIALKPKRRKKTA